MNAGLRTHGALHFGIVFVPLLLLFGWVYQADLIDYDERVRAAANLVLEGRAPLAVIESGQDRLWLFSLVNMFGVPESFLRVEMQYRFFGIALLPALLLATPVRAPRWKRVPESVHGRLNSGTFQLPLRLLVATGGVLLLWVVHVTSSVGWVHAANCARFHPREFFCPALMGLLTHANAVYPVILWGLLTWPSWLVRRATARAT